MLRVLEFYGVFKRKMVKFDFFLASRDPRTLRNPAITLRQFGHDDAWLVKGTKTSSADADGRFVSTLFRMFVRKKGSS